MRPGGKRFCAWGDCLVDAKLSEGGYISLGGNILVACIMGSIRGG